MIKKPSKIHGYGIFADKAIVKGSNFYQIPTSKTSKQPQKSWARIADRYVCDTEILNWVNHSCQPNCAIDSKNIALLALCDINKGDEITCDYNQTEIDGLLVKCDCGKRSCRGFFAREE